MLNRKFEKALLSITLYNNVEEKRKRVGNVLPVFFVQIVKLNISSKFHYTKQTT